MKLILKITFSLLVACHTSLCLAGVPRVALMPSGDPKAAAIVELMEVELAQRDDVVLLDRANVGRILGEQKMVLEGLLSADDAFAIGQLLGCDVFGELFFQAKDDGASAVGVLTAFDAVTGVRLCDATLDASGRLQAISVAAGKILMASLQKRTDTVSQTNVRAVTLLSVRNVDLPQGQAHLPETMGPMLERQLLRSTGITVLERKRLNLVNQEAALTEDLRERLLASSVLLDLDLTRGTTVDQVSVRGVVSNNAGKELAVVKYEHNGADAEGLVAALAQRLLEALEVPVVMQAGNKNKQEADRFAAESRRLLRRNRLEEALVAAECAHALNPQDFRIQALLCEALEHRADIYAKDEKCNKLFDLLDRTWSFREQWIDGRNIDSSYPGKILRLVLDRKQHLNTEQYLRLRQIQELYCQWVTTHCRQESIAKESELWAASPAEWMDGLFALYKGFPEELASYGKWRPHPLVFQLTEERKRRLMTLNEQRAANGDPRGFIECMMLAHFMPDVFDGAQDIVQRNRDGLVNMAIEDKNGTGLIAYVASTLYSLRVELGATRIHPAMLQLQAEYDARKFVCPIMMRYFECPMMQPYFESYYSSDNMGGYNRGTYTGDMARKLTAGYSVSTNRYVNACGIDYSTGHTTDPELLLQQCKQQYNRLTRKELKIDLFQETKKIPHWERQDKIYEIGVADNQHSVIQGVAQQDNLVFLAIYCRAQNPSTTLIEFDLAAGGQRIVSMMPGCVQPHYRHDNSDLFNPHPFDFDRGNLSIGEKAVYLPGKDGLIIFPRNGNAPRLLRSGKDLPDANVISAIEIGESIYLACDKTLINEETTYGTVSDYDDDGNIISTRKFPSKSTNSSPAGGMLLKIDLNGENQVIITHSERKAKHSPLDNCDPYWIEGFLHDSTNRRLYFMIKGLYDSNHRGIWMMEFNSGSIKRVLSLCSPHHIAPQDNGCLWIDEGFGIMSWNPATQESKRLIGETIERNLPARYWLKSFHHVRCAAMLNDVMYIRGQDTVSGKQGLLPLYESAEITENTNVGLEPFLGNPPIFLQAWQGMLVAADRYSLWLLKPNESPVF